MMITLFTIPRAFKGHHGQIQRNAIACWKKLDCEIILCGDDEGVKEAAAEFGVIHIGGVKTNDLGTPYLDDCFAKCVARASNDIVCYVNGDIILTAEIINAAKNIPLKSFLAIGRRIDIKTVESLDLDCENWQQNLHEYAAKEGTPHAHTGIDYFMFRKDPRLIDMPPLLIGRAMFDNWFVRNARKNNVPVIDCSEVVEIYHQAHDFSHVPQGNGTWEGPETDHNRALYENKSEHIFTINDATRVLREDGLYYALEAKYLHHRWKAMEEWYPRLLIPLAFVYFRSGYYLRRLFEKCHKHAA